MCPRGEIGRHKDLKSLPFGVPVRVAEGTNHIKQKIKLHKHKLNQS